MIFEIHGEFEASDIDDALAYLAAHFAEFATPEVTDDNTRLCAIEVAGQGMVADA